MKPKGIMYSMAIVCLLLGIMIAMQFRGNQSNPDNIPLRRAQDLTVELDKMSQERDALAEEVVKLREKVNKGDVTGLGDELEKANMAAGLLPVHGAGVVLTLNDSNHVLQPGEDPNLYLIHDEDLLKMVNELRAAGAEAISVNEERLTANSEIRCAGTTILVNVTKIGPPFVIAAVGDPETLERSLRIKGGWLSTLEIWGINAQIEKSNEVKVPAYRGSIKFEFAKPTKVTEG
ncbi:MAG: DUF881 domain-containing protein [Methylocystaceae bacterium]